MTTETTAFRVLRPGEVLIPAFIEVGPSGFKPAEECTREDLDAAEAYARLHGDVNDLDRVAQVRSARGLGGPGTS